MFNLKKYGISIQCEALTSVIAGRKRKERIQNISTDKPKISFFFPFIF